MAGRRFLVAAVVLSAVLHGLSIARSRVPAQDGLKFIAVARQFQTDSWPDVVRDTDQHPLYPALVAAVEPAVAFFTGPGPDAWRLAAQIVAAVASVLILLPLFGLVCALFDGWIAGMAVMIYALLPVPGEIGHDTLSDSLGLLALVLCLRYGALAVRTGGWQYALAAGLAGGVGYLARPEVILAPLALGLTWVIVKVRAWDVRSLVTAPALPVLCVSAMVFVGGYALVKGQVTEKLALRHGAVPRSSSCSGRSRSSCRRVWTTGAGTSRRRRTRSEPRCGIPRGPCTGCSRSGGMRSAGASPRWRSGGWHGSGSFSGFAARATRAMQDRPSAWCWPHSRLCSCWPCCGTPRRWGISRVGTRCRWS